MTGALIILAFTVFTGFLLWVLHRLTGRVGTPGDSPAESPADTDAGCCGRHIVCEKQAVQTTPEIIYFDDEELDAYAGRDESTYTDLDVEKFREVLYTLLPEDVYPWGVSLSRRDISLPASLRDEWIMLCEK